ncbi:MAG: hypothetical protein ABI432_09805 [Flavobacteriales bacterium]
MTRKILLLAAIVGTLHASAQVITYDWLNVICSGMINCDEGCSACNMPVDAPGVFIGTNVAWLGVGTCPYPVASGDNAIYSTGWTELPSTTQSILLSGIATTELHIDSIIIRHAAWENGPQRAKILFTPNVAAAMVEIGDVTSTPEFTTSVFTDLGCLEIPEGSSMATFQLKVIPYQSAIGGWALDEVRIVATPCEASAVGIHEIFNTSQNVGPYFDILGHPAAKNPAPGVYIGPKKQVQVF